MDAVDDREREHFARAHHAIDRPTNRHLIIFIPTGRWQ
jgi:hypothetical protein